LTSVLATDTDDLFDLTADERELVEEYLSMF